MIHKVPAMSAWLGNVTDSVFSFVESYSWMGFGGWYDNHRDMYTCTGSYNFLNKKMRTCGRTWEYTRPKKTQRGLYYERWTKPTTHFKQLVLLQMVSFCPFHLMEGRDYRFCLGFQKRMCCPAQTTVAMSGRQHPIFHVSNFKLFVSIYIFNSFSIMFVVTRPNLKQ